MVLGKPRKKWIPRRVVSGVKDQVTETEERRALTGASGRLRSSLPLSFTVVEMLGARDLVYFPSYI